MNPSTVHPGRPKRPSRHLAIWILTPLMILLYMLALMRASGASVFDDLQVRRVYEYGSLALSLALLVLAAGWLGRLSGLLIFRGRNALPSATAWVLIAFFTTPARHTLSWTALAQLLFILTLGAMLLVTLVSLLRQPPIGPIGPMSPSSCDQATLAKRAAGRGDWRDYLAMTKPGLNGLVLVTTLIGFYLGTIGPLDWPLGLCTMLGTALTAAGASVLNQFIERQPDACMARTAGRPLPTGRLAPRQGFVFGAGLALAGLALLLLTVNLLTAYLAALSLASYLWIYTPLKRINTLSTLAGAISGALPPVLGWTGAAGRIELPALVLFFILFLWQIPHFLSIAWKYREQYGAAGFRMLSVLDPQGRATGLQALLYAGALLPISLLTSFEGLTGPLYLAGAFVLGLSFLIACLLFAWQPGQGSARRLFFASIAYLPLLLLLMAANKAGLE